MADADYDRGFLAGQESLDRDLDACKDKLEAGEAKLAEVEKERDEWCEKASDRLRRWTDERENLRASMDRARETAQDLQKHEHLVVGATAKGWVDEIARLLSGDE